MPYLTLADSKTWLGIEPSDTTKDSLLTELISAVEEAINAWTGTQFDSVQTTTNELHDARRQDVLLPLNGPIRTVTSVKVGVNSDGSGGQALDAAGYRYDDTEIAMIYMHMAHQRGLVAITYTWGYDSVPARVSLAAKLGVEGYYRMRQNKTVGGIAKSRAKEGESISYGSGTATGGSRNNGWEGGLPPEAINILSEFRRVDFDFGSGTAMATRNN